MSNDKPLTKEELEAVRHDVAMGVPLDIREARELLAALDEARARVAALSEACEHWRADIEQEIARAEKAEAELAKVKAERDALSTAYETRHADACRLLLANEKVEREWAAKAEECADALEARDAANARVAELEKTMLKHAPCPGCGGTVTTLIPRCLKCGESFIGAEAAVYLDEHTKPLRARVAQLEAALKPILLRWGQHSGLCCDNPVLAQDVDTLRNHEGCVCDQVYKNARAALSGQPPPVDYAKHAEALAVTAENYDDAIQRRGLMGDVKAVDTEGQRAHVATGDDLDSLYEKWMEAVDNYRAALKGSGA